MRQFGYKLVQVWLDAKEAAALKKVADEHLARGASVLRKLLCDAADIPYVRR